MATPSPQERKIVAVNVNVAVVVAAVAVVVRFRSGDAAGRGRTAGGRAGVGRWIARVGRLLPASARVEYVEEWQRWLQDMKEEGDPWYRRFVEAVSLLAGIPRLALVLWRRQRQVVR